jgi:hypothetical protein
MEEEEEEEVKEEELDPLCPVRTNSSQRRNIQSNNIRPSRGRQCL